MDQARFSSGRLGLALGKLSYASYLIHIPIQIVVLIALDVWAEGRTLIESPIFLLAYVFSVLLLSMFAYRFIERPGQDILRRFLGGARLAVSAPAAG